MSNKSRETNVATLATRASPVRVKLERVTAEVSRNVAPDNAELSGWRERLRSALGTTSDEFVNATLFQLQAAARLPNSGVSEIAVNAALAFIESAKTQSELESALVVQMACTHAAAMSVLARLGGGHGGDRHVTAAATAASRLLKAFSTQVETFRRLKHGSAQTIRIERVDVRDGGQAVIGRLK